MIQITFNFVSMDAARMALLEIPESWLVGHAGAEVEIVEEKKPEPKASPEKKSTPAKQEAASTQPTAQADAAPEKKAENSDSKPESIEYPVLQKAVFALAAKSREAATQLVATFGVKTFKELGVEQEKDGKKTLVEKEPGIFAKALAAVNAKLAEV